MSPAASLDHLPEVGPRRVAVRVTPDALRRIRAGHPWVYDRSVRSASHDGAPGDLAVVFDRDRRFAAVGLWDPTSPIRVRVLAHGDPVTIDAAWFADRLVAAVARRAPLWGHQDGSAPDRSELGWRVVNGEGDGLPGLVIDQYADTAVVKLYSEVWWVHLADVLAGLVAATGPRRIVLRLARRLHVAAGGVGRHGLVDGQVLAGPPPHGPIRFVENELWFEADVIAGQKTGHFLDQRRNRRHVRDLALGRRVLDVFASTGGFAVHAAAGGARSVHAVDVSAPTLAAVRRNLDLNRDLEPVGSCAVTTEVADAFDSMATLARAGRRFDLVVVDPPSFAQRAEQVERALRAYRRLTTLALDLVEPGGLVVQASCSSRVDVGSFHAAVADAARARGVRLVERRRTAHDVDHPVTDSFPEGAYLKAGIWRVS